MFLFQHRIRRNEQTVRVCAEKGFVDTDSSRDKHDSPARTWSHPRRHLDTPAPTCPHASARPRAPRRPKTTTTVLCWDFWAYFFNFSKFKNFWAKIEEPPQKHEKN